MKRRLERIDESIARYLSQLDTADRQAAAGADVPAAKVTRLKDKLAKLLIRPVEVFRRRT